MIRRQLSCRQVGRSLQEFLDNEVHDDEYAARLQQHLDACRECGLELETYRALQRSIRRPAVGAEPPELQRLRDFGHRLASGNIDP